MQPAFGVIGLGRMAQALVLPLLERGRIRADQVLAVVGGSGALEQRREALPAGIGLVGADDPAARLVWMAPVQLLAVKPQQLDAVAAASAPVTGQPLLISVLAGVSLASSASLPRTSLCEGSAQYPGAGRRFDGSGPGEGVTGNKGIRCGSCSPMW